MTTDADAIEQIAPDFTYVDAGRRFPEARLVEPTTSGYLLVAAEIDRRPMVLPDSRGKRRLLRHLTRLLSTLEADERVLEAHAFDGLLAPPGRGELLKYRPGVPVARFDLAVLVETTSPATAAALEAERPWAELVAAVEAASRRSYHLRGHNVRRMGPVDHHRQGVFLFNYFYADRTDLNLAAWQYTAGWFRDQTGLDNSTVLAPDATSEPRYRLVNTPAGTGSATCCRRCCSSAASAATCWRPSGSTGWPPCRCCTGWLRQVPPRRRGVGRREGRQTA